MKKIVLLFAILLSTTAFASAQTMPDSISPQSLMQVPENGLKPVKIGGYFFSVPDYCMVQSSADNKILIKYPDGSFGVSATVYPEHIPQKDARELCKSSAKQMKLRDIKTTDLKTNGLSGACTSGVIEAQRVNILVLSGNSAHIEMIILSSAAQQRWADEVISSIRN